MALGPVTTPGNRQSINQLGQTNPGFFRDVYGFDNEPDATGLPDVYDEEVGRYGNRTVNNFLRMVSAELPTTSKRVQWGEEGRLNVYCSRARRSGAGATVFTINTNDGTLTPDTGHGFRINDKVLVGDGTNTFIGLVTAAPAAGSTITIASSIAVSSGDAGFAGLASGTTNLSLLVVGSDEQKGGDSRGKTLQPEFDSYTNDTIRIRETYSINGSDMSQIGWLKSEGSYYWHIKGQSDTAKRFENNLEMSMVEDRQNAASSAALAAGRSGSEGLFAAIREGGNLSAGGFTSAGSAADGRDDFDVIVNQLDREGAIEENGLWLGRTDSLAVDNILATQNSYGSGGSSWGVFNNSEDMGINLGFKSWRRGSYDFYKTDWKYLNQLDGRSSFNDVRGISVPMGMKNVYGEMGEKMSQPFLHVKYLSGPSGSRKMMTWAHGGSAQGGYTSGVDETKIEFLSERCLCTLGRNNFFMFTA